MKKTILLCICLLFIGITSQAQKTLPLPQGTVITKGALTAKVGYKFVLLADKKSATLVNVNAKDNNIITGSYSCGCGEGKAGSCFIVVQDNTLYCNGSCACSITVTVQGNGYAVNLQTGMLESKNKKVVSKN